MREKRKKEPKLHSFKKIPGEDDFYQPQTRKMLAFTGSLMTETRETRRMARLHKKITARETNYQQKRHFIELSGMLSQWFNTNLLDRVFHFLQDSDYRKEPSTEEEIIKIVANLDVLLRLEGNTIRWKTLIEISDYFLLEITRKSLFKYRTRAHRALFELHGRKLVLEKLRRAPDLLLKRLISEFIANDMEMDDEEKNLVKVGCLQVIMAINNLRYTPRDYEIYAYAIFSLMKKNLTGRAGKYSFPVDDPKFRRTIANATYNIKKRVIEKSWVSIPLVSFPDEGTEGSKIKAAINRI
ncbi:MAG: hypothetical protein ACXAEU_15330 [Candidatus Hodarchaeales archaeon]|jgi:hypothetical protein